MELRISCLKKHVIRFIGLQDDLVDWWNKYLRERTFCTPPKANGIDLDGLYNEISNRICIFETYNPVPDD